ncbi:MAG TPA: TonB-dependent receptor [bacterium]|nr:TonB-dependent receptor [bacterium]
MRHLSLIAVTAALLGFGPLTAPAQPAPKPGAEIGELVVEDRADPLGADKPSAFFSVIYPDEYSDQLTTLPELLSREVGIHVQNFGGLGQLSTVSIRGSTAEQVSVYLDGIKLNTAEGGAVDFSTLPLGAIERVEILRGGASSQFGSDAIGGVINIVTKRAPEKAAWELKFSEGSFFTIQTHEGFAKRFGKIGFVIDHTHLSSAGDFTFLNTGVELAGGQTLGGGQEFKRLHNSFYSEGVLTRVDAELDAKKRLTFVNDFFLTSEDLPGTEFETTQLLPVNPLTAHEDLVRNVSGISFVWEDFAAEGLSFSLFPNYRFERSHFHDRTPALGPPIDVISLNQSVDFKPRFDYERLFKGHGHRFTFLYDFRYDRFNDSSPLAGAKLSGLHTRRTNAVFFQDEIALLGERLLLNPSVRYEHANDFGGDVALHFGLVGKATDWLSFKTNVENSFRYPSFNELYLPDQGFIRGNPDLLKEQAISFDVGADFRWRWIKGELSYFRNAIDNSIVFVPISVFTIAPLNTGPATAQGLEASLALKPLSFLEITGNYTFLDAELNGSGNQLPGRPRHLANGRVEFSWKYGGFFAEVQYIDKLPIDFSNTRFIVGKALVDVGGTFKWKDHYFLTVQGKNVGNVQTLDSVGFPLPRASVYLSFGYKN